MDKAVLERRLHLTVTFIGGFMGCYAMMFLDLHRPET